MYKVNRKKVHLKMLQTLNKIPSCYIGEVSRAQALPEQVTLTTHKGFYWKIILLQEKKHPLPQRSACKHQRIIKTNTQMTKQNAHLHENIWMKQNSPAEYLLEAVQDLPQLRLHTKGGLQRPPVDPIIFTPCRRSFTDQQRKNESMGQVYKAPQLN